MLRAGSNLRGAIMITVTEQPMPKSRRGAMRQYNALMSAYKRAFAGGGTFGWDHRTMRLNDSETYAKLQALRAVYSQLPE